MRQNVPLLTKSDYLDGLQCPKRLYLKKYQPELEEALSPGACMRMEDGKDIGILARGLFAGGLLIEGFGGEAVEATKVGMMEADVLFEAQFACNGRLAKVDILERARGGWRLIEVKSSKAPADGKGFKRHHLEDVAFQVLVLREAGVSVVSAHLLLLSKEYRLEAGGELDLRAYFTECDVSAEVEKLLIDANFRSIAMIESLGRETAPNVEINVRCEGCGFFGHCGSGISEDHLIFLPGIKGKDLDKFRADGVGAIPEIPDASKLTVAQRAALVAHRSGKPFISDRLAGELEAAHYPLYFVDFEATQWAIPELPGTAAHEAIPFQWSCHIQRSMGGRLEHREFLARTGGDPRGDFARSLFECVRDAGSIVVYSSYEKTRVKDLRFAGFPHGEALERLFAERQVDLYSLVRQNVYWPAFRGSFSLKEVLPAVVPNLSYEDLAIQDGSAASAEFKRMLAALPEDADRIARNLLDYCERDTLAMVELFAALRRVAGLLEVSQGGTGQLAFNL